MKVSAQLNNLRIAPRKVRLVTDALRGIDVREGMLQLSKQAKKSSEPIEKLLRSAVANAVNNFGLDETNLYVAEIQVGDGLRLKRWLPRAQGRATPLIRRGSNIRLVLEEKIEGKNRVLKKKPAPKKAVSIPEEPEGASETAEQAVPRAQLPVKKRGGEISKQTMNKGAAKKMFQRKAT